MDSLRKSKLSERARMDALKRAESDKAIFENVKELDAFKNAEITYPEKDKMLVKPGITGLTQAHYRNGLGVREKRLYDAWYAHNVTLALDIKIIFRTVKTVLCRENLYTNSSEDTVTIGEDNK